MKKTGIVLGVLVAGAIVWELIGRASSTDDVWTITAFFRALPCWGVVGVIGFLCALAAHIWWR